MSVSLNVHGVARNEVHAYSAPLVTVADAPRMHCQTLCLLDADHRRIGQIVLFFDNPSAALPVGDCSQLDEAVPAGAGLSGCAAPERV